MIQSRNSSSTTLQLSHCTWKEPFLQFSGAGTVPGLFEVTLNCWILVLVSFGFILRQATITSYLKGWILKKKKTFLSLGIRMLCHFLTICYHVCHFLTNFIDKEVQVPKSFSFSWSGIGLDFIRSAVLPINQTGSPGPSSKTLLLTLQIFLLSNRLSSHLLSD